MNICEIIFSPTGGVQKAADCLAAALGETIRSIDLCDRNLDFSACSVAEDELAVIAIPAYGGRMPVIAEERLSRIRGCGAKAVLLAVYGNRAIDDTLIHMQDVAQGAGFACIAGVSAVAEHVFCRDFGAGRPDEADFAVLKGYAVQILQKIERNETGLKVPGNRPYRAFGGVAVKPYAGEGCAKCGLCAEKCPAGAISVDDPGQTDAGKCISCMRCIAVCPAGARTSDPAPLNAIADRLRPICSDRKDYVLYID